MGRSPRAGFPPAAQVGYLSAIHSWPLQAGASSALAQWDLAQWGALDRRARAQAPVSAAATVVAPWVANPNRRRAACQPHLRARRSRAIGLQNVRRSLSTGGEWPTKRRA